MCRPLPCSAPKRRAAASKELAAAGTVHTTASCGAARPAVVASRASTAAAVMRVEAYEGGGLQRVTLWNCPLSFDQSVTLYSPLELAAGLQSETLCSSTLGATAAGLPASGGSNRQKYSEPSPI